MLARKPLEIGGRFDDKSNHARTEARDLADGRLDQTKLSLSFHCAFHSVETRSEPDHFLSMNYFGHAALSVLRFQGGANGDPARFILGSMLPDLLAMIGQGVTRFEDPDVSAGARFHVEVDALFHQTPTFVQLNRTALKQLRESGVSRGPARACAHIGVEMLIDAELVRDERLLRGYLDALDAARTNEAIFAPVPPSTARRVGELCAHLATEGAAVHLTSRERLRLRLGHTLRHRPRLAPTARELDLISDYLCDFDAVKNELPGLMTQLEPLYERPGASRAES